MKNKILPIGSVVKANNQDVMICAYVNKDSTINNEKYDYVCCLYPNGIGEEAILLKKEQIQKILFIGYQDSRFESMRTILEKDHA